MSLALEMPRQEDQGFTASLSFSKFKASLKYLRPGLDKLKSKQVCRAPQILKNHETCRWAQVSQRKMKARQFGPTGHRKPPSVTSPESEDVG